MRLVDAAEIKSAMVKGQRLTCGRLHSDKLRPARPPYFLSAAVSASIASTAAHTSSASTARMQHWPCGSRVHRTCWQRAPGWWELTAR